MIHLQRYVFFFDSDPRNGKKTKSQRLAEYTDKKQAMRAFQKPSLPEETGNPG